MNNTRIERQKIEIEKQKAFLADCMAFCDKFPSIESREKCIQQKEQIESMERRLQEQIKEQEKQELSELRRKKHSGKHPILEQVTGGKEAWDIIDSLLEDPKYETDTERKIALEIQLTQLSRNQ